MATGIEVTMPVHCVILYLRALIHLKRIVEKIEVMTRTATKFLSLLLSCVALGSDTQGTYKEQNLLFVRHARGWKIESGVQKNRSIKPKNRLKAKKWPDVWQGQHQVLEVQQALISLTQEIISLSGFISAKKPSLWEDFLYIRGFCAARQGFSHKNLEYDKKEE